MSYIGNSPVISATRTITEVVASGGQTVFYPNGGYTVGYLDVIVNGAELQTSDFVATNGTSVTLNVACANGDDVRMVAYGTFTTSSSYTQSQVDSKIGAAQYGFKNRIINGAMGIWQRGTSSSTSGAYLADRFFISGSSSITGTQSTDVPSTAFKYSLSLSGTGYPQTVQRIESLNTYDLVGQSVTVSFWAKQTSGAGAGSLAVILYYANSQDNFASQTAVASAVTFTGTSSWVQYTATFTNLPSGVANGLSCTLYANTAGAATWLITGVQLEKGSTATSFDYRPYGTELALCQRYYWQINNGNSPYSVIGITGQGNNIYTVWFPQTMRAAPTGTFSNSTGPQLYFNSAGGTQNMNYPTAANVNAGTNGARFYTTTPALSGQAGLVCWFDMGNGNCNISFSSEL